nr:hypothetical protein [Tanacetum cinerariifolium]
VKEKQEKDKIGSKLDKNGKRVEAEKSLKQLQWVEKEKLSKTQKEWPKTQAQSKAIQEWKARGQVPLVKPLDIKKFESSSYHALGDCLNPYRAFLRRDCRRVPRLVVCQIHEALLALALSMGNQPLPFFDSAVLTVSVNINISGFVASCHLVCTSLDGFPRTCSSWWRVLLFRIIDGRRRLVDTSGQQSGFRGYKLRLGTDNEHQPGKGRLELHLMKTSLVKVTTDGEKPDEPILKKI